MTEFVKAHEAEPALDKQTFYFLLGATSELVLRVNEDPNKSTLTDLRMFLSHLTLPLGETLDDYLAHLGMNSHIAAINQNKTKAGDLLAGLAMGIRNRSINWYDYEDPILREAMITPGEKLDADKECEVSYWDNGYHVRWVLPKPEVYWECEEPDKLIHIAVIALEEMLHLTQMKGNKFELHSLGCEFDLSDPELRPMQKFVVRMSELDAFNVLSTAMPEMIEEEWAWYKDRASKKTYDDHYPHSIDISFMLGYAFSAAMDQWKEYMAGTMASVPEFLEKNPLEREAFFSNHYVLGNIKQYFEWIYNSDDLATKLEPDQIKLIFDHEFNKYGITTQFLIHCAELKERHGENWMEILDRGRYESSEHSSVYGTEMLDMLLNFVNTNPKWFNKLTNKKTLFPIKFKKQKFSDVDHMVGSFAKSLH